MNFKNSNPALLTENTIVSKVLNMENKINNLESKDNKLINKLYYKLVNDNN